MLQIERSFSILTSFDVNSIEAPTDGLDTWRWIIFGLLVQLCHTLIYLVDHKQQIDHDPTTYKLEVASIERRCIKESKLNRNAMAMQNERKESVIVATEKAPAREKLLIKSIRKYINHYFN